MLFPFVLTVDFKLVAIVILMTLMVLWNKQAKERFCLIVAFFLALLSPVV